MNHISPIYDPVNSTFENSTWENPAAIVRMPYHEHTFTDAILGARVSWSRIRSVLSFWQVYTYVWRMEKYFDRYIYSVAGKV